MATVDNGVTGQPTVTELNHVALAIAGMATTHYTLVRPLMSTAPYNSLGFMGAAIFVWCFIFPVLMIATGAYEATLTGEAFFVIVKLLSVAFGVLSMQSFVAYYCKKGHVSRFALTWVLNMVVIANVSEAVMTQYGNWKEPEDPEQTEPYLVDLLNALVGVGLNVVLFWYGIAGSGMDIIRRGENNTTVQLVSDYRPWFIMSYTFWNMLFRSRLDASTVGLFFFGVSLLLPLIEHFSGEGDWLQVRGISLLAYLVYGLGLTPGQGRLFPVYNSQGYWKEGDDKSFITVVQQSQVYLWLMWAAAAITLVLAVWETHVQSTTFVGVFTTQRVVVKDRVSRGHIHAPHLPAMGVHEGKQKRMHRRGHEPEWKVHAQRGVGVAVLLGVLALCVATALVPDVVVPGFDAADYDGGNSTAQLGLSEYLEDNCLGEACPAFGIALASFFGIVVAFFVFNRLFPLLAFVLTILSLATILPYALTFDTMDGVFEYIKLISVAGGASFIAIFRVDNILRQNKREQVGYYEPGSASPWASFARWIGDNAFPPNSFIDASGWCWVLLAALAINLAEPVVTDIINGNYMNAAVGFWLILALPRPPIHRFDAQICFFAKMRKSWTHLLFIDDSHTAFYDMVYETNAFWVLMYASWALCFSYDERREHFAAFIVLIAASLFTELPRSLVRLDPHLWVQSMTYGLFCYYAILAIRDPYETFADSTHWFNEHVVTAWGATNLGIVVLYTAWEGYTYGDGSKQRRTSFGSRASRESIGMGSVISGDRSSQRLSAGRRGSFMSDSGAAATTTVSPLKDPDADPATASL